MQLTDIKWELKGNRAMVVYKQEYRSDIHRGFGL